MSRDDEKPAARRYQLPPEAYERAREIAASAPPVSEAKIARLRMIICGMPAGSAAPAAGPADGT